MPRIQCEYTRDVANAATPLWTDTEIRVKTVPVDPRSMPRGNCARLRYEFGTLPDDALNEAEGLRVGEVVYVSFEQAEGDEYELGGASLDRPDGDTFPSGRIVTKSPPLRVKYGIEAFFASKEKALKLERGLRDGGTAVKMVTDGGRVALEEVIPAYGYGMTRQDWEVQPVVRNVRPHESCRNSAPYATVHHRRGALRFPPLRAFSRKL